MKKIFVFLLIVSSYAFAMEIEPVNKKRPREEYASEECLKKFKPEGRTETHYGMTLTTRGNKITTFLAALITFKFISDIFNGINGSNHHKPYHDPVHE